MGESESRPHHQLKGCQWVSRRMNKCIASGKGVETGGSLYLDMEVAKGSEVAGTTVTALTIVPLKLLQQNHVGALTLTAWD